ncbi:MAG TPA: hypothetical protein VFT13_07900 [Candidatus Krumholzibacteria bacterium]|nr:hypothetical protein [Candidatus Krumholzibacteria bacterium]
MHGRRAVALALVAAISATAPYARALEAVVDHGCIGWDVGTRFSRPLGIFFDTVREECYVADTGNHRVVVCDRDGSPVYRFNHYVEKDGAAVLGEPRSIAVDATGRIFLVDDAAAGIDVLDTTGRRIGFIAPPADDCGVAESFEFVAPGPGGMYAVLSCAKRRVAVIDAGLEIARVITLSWKDAAQRACLTGIAVDADGGIYVTDACASDMVQMYDANGGLVRSFGTHDTGLENFSFASGIALMADGNMWIVDTLRHIASLFTPEGTRLVTVGGKGAEPGALQYPSCVTTDGVGRVFVAERAGNRYQCFRVEGELPESETPAQRQLGMLLEESETTRR